MPEKIRLDTLLVERKLVPSREIGQSLILRGDVLVNNVPVTKAGTKIDAGAEVRIRGDLPRYVGRGGEKLAGALEHFALDVNGVVAIDVGASTGGFTDCLLQNGARLVYAVDVGYNQLDLKLRSDPRVKVFEETNAKELPEFPEPPALAVIDVSFIGLRKILSPVAKVLARPAQILALVKPQFELGPEYVEKGGVVRSEEHQLLAVKLVNEFCREQGWTVGGSVPAQIRGAKKGNQEYFLYVLLFP